MAGTDADTHEQHADAAAETETTETAPELTPEQEVQAAEQKAAEQVGKVGAVLDRVFGRKAADSEEAIPSTETAAADDGSGKPTDTKVETEDDGGYTPELLAGAKDAGYTDESARQFQPEQLASIVAAHNRKMADIGRAARKAEQEAAKPAADAAPTAKPPEPEAEAEVETADDDKELAALDKVTAAEFGEEVAEAMKVLKARDARRERRLKQIEKELAKVKEAPKPKAGEGPDPAQIAHYEAVDDCIKNLDPSWNGVFGTGTFRDADHWAKPENAEQVKARRKVCDVMASIARATPEAERVKLTYGALFTKALFVLHEDRMTQAITKKTEASLKGRLQNRRGQHTYTVPPTHTAAPPGSKEDKQLARVGNVLEKVKARSKK